MAETAVRVRERHSRLTFTREMTTRICARIQDYEGRPPPDRGVLAYRDADDQAAAIDLDVDDIYAAGEPIPLQVRLRNVHGNVDGVAVAAILRPVGDPGRPGAVAAGEPIRLVWDQAAGCFVGDMTPAGTGIYDLTVTVEAVPGAGNLAVSESVAVIEP